MNYLENKLSSALYAAVAIAVSVLLHVLLWVGAGYLGMPDYGGSDGEETDEEDRISLSNVDVRDRMFKPRSDQNGAEDALDTLATTMQKNTSVRELFQEQRFLKTPDTKVKLSGLGRNLLKPKPSDTEAPQLAAAPRPEIVDIDMEDLAPERATLDRRTRPKLPRRNVDEENLPSLVTSDEVRRATGTTIGAGMRLSTPKVKPLSMPDFNDGNGNGDGEDTGKSEGEDAADRFKPDSSLPGLPTSDNGHRNGDIAELDSLLTVSLHKRELPSGGGFFRVDIQPNARSDRLLAIPKDILFIIDCSASISHSKLDQFKSATLEALAYLNRHDRFNIVTFRDQPNRLFESPVTPTEDRVAQVEDFFRQLYRKGKTDVYAGIAPFVKKDSERKRPLNVFVMTDGRSTVENHLDNETMIRQIASLNQADVSIYTFSAGDKVNRFLLDLLAYTNRGISLHETSLENFSDQLVDFISGHSELILQDLRYNITGGMRGSIYPKRLPHLYRGETLSVYGRYPEGTDQIAIQIVGADAQGKLEELIFRGDLAEATDGSNSLEIDWAAQRIFYLLARRTLHPSAEVTATIRRLARQYNIYVPYL
ncbi:MAG: VWA domain-containing protein [Verrucomicrobiota bacterium]